MNQPQIRLATKEDLPALIDLWAYCFADGDIFRNWYFKYYYRQDECIVASIDGTPVASLQVIDLPTRVGGQSLAAGYIVGVNCLPEYRGQGLTRMLMDEALNHFAPQKGYRLLHLMPFEADFYEPYGFVYGDYHANMTLPIEEFYRADAREEARQHHWRTVDLNDTAEMLDTLEALYDAALEGFDAYVERHGARRWSALLDDVRLENGHLKVLYNEADEAVGYLAYIVQEDALLIREMQSLNAGARKAMYYFIASHRSQVKTVKWSAAENEPVVYRRKKDKDGVALQPFMMCKVLDPKIVGLFASKLPKENLEFYVEGCGRYQWQAQSTTVLRTGDRKEGVACFSLQVLNRMLFERGGWFYDEADPLQKQMAALFKEKTQFFNNEYF